MLLKTDAQPREVWGVMIGDRHEVVSSYLCESLEKANRLADAHRKQFGQEAWPLQLTLTLARADP